MNTDRNMVFDAWPPFMQTACLIGEAASQRQIKNFEWNPFPFRILKRKKSSNTFQNCIESVRLKFRFNWMLHPT